MADFDLSIPLSLEKAEVRGRDRLNALGSKELIIEYPRIAPAYKQDAVDWLEANRLTATDPKVNFNTIEGTWKCVAIEWDDKRNVIIQRFKIDSQLGNYDPSTKTGDGHDAALSVTETAERTYFFRVVDPSAIELPDSTTAGTTWDLSAIDNGDGTYDVTVTKRTAINTNLSDHLVAKDASSATTADIEWNATSEDAITVPSSPAIGDSYRKSVSKNRDGSFDLQVEKRTATNVTESSEVVFEDDANRTVADYTWNDSSASSLPISSVSAGETHRRRIGRNQDGTFDIVREVSTASELEGTSTIENPFYRETRTVTINDAALDFDSLFEAYIESKGYDITTEYNTDVGFDSSGSWTLVNSTVDGVLTLTAGAGQQSRAELNTSPLTSGSYYRLRYTIDSTSGSPALELGNSWANVTELPVDSGSYDLVFEAQGTEIRIEQTEPSSEIVMSSFSITNYYGNAPRSVPTSTEMYWAYFHTNMIVGYIFRVENIPQDNGLYRTEFVVREATQNLQWNTTGTYEKLFTIKNGTEQFVNTTLGTASVTIQGTPSVNVNEFGLFDVSFIYT